MSDEDLIGQVQQATFDSGLLVQATGGVLKQEKCKCYCWCLWNGEPRLKSVAELPDPIAQVEQKDGATALAHLTITQPDGTTTTMSVPVGDFKF